MGKGAEQLARRGGSFGDLLLPVAVIAVVGMMVFPLPLTALDILLMCNLAFSLCLLIASVYLNEPEKFTALPTILLLSTLFRLGLNISTTRQLLGHGAAPDIVVVFGHFVVEGNLVVGAVIFGIVTLVQFMVIAKGAERVAEVAARFTLDAMPGKQMSIDADVRAGILSLVEARERRRDLQRESKLYGSLDGAMKFVKGDAIAGLLITLINITAGLIIGVQHHKLGISEALHTYTIFTVGDGLVSQIPALLVAVAAGICVTRVSDKDGSFLGREMFAQLGQEPKALRITGTFLLLLGLVPGLPTIWFVLLGGTLFVLASGRTRVQSENARRTAETEFRPKVLTPLTLSLSARATQLLQAERTLPTLLKSARAEVFANWGIVVPDVQFEVEPSLPEIAADICFGGIRMATVRWNGQKVADRPQKLSEAVAQEYRGFIKRYLPEFLDDTHTRVLFEVHQPSAEDLINSVVPGSISVTALTSLLKKLVREQVSIRELRTILQAVAEFHLLSSGEDRRGIRTKEMGASEGAELRDLLAEVRIALRRTISQKLVEASDGNADRYTVRGWLLDGQLDQLLLHSVLTRAPIEPAIVEEIVQTVQLLGKPRTGDERAPTFVILTSKHARATLSRLLSERCPWVIVAAVDEIAEEVHTEIQGVLKIPPRESVERGAVHNHDTQPDLKDQNKVVPFTRLTA